MARSILLIPVLLAIIGSTQLGLSQSKSPRQIAQEAFPSVVLLVMQDSNGQPTSLGSGFVLRDGIVATNHHVITGAPSGYCKVVGKNMKYEIAGTVGMDEAHDLAIVAVNGLKAPPMPIGDSSQVAVGDEVFAVGNPQGLEGTFSQGIISAVRRVGGDTILQITAPISPGSSGGPILNNSGKTIGVAVATFKGGQNLNLAIPSSYLTALFASVSAEVLPLSRQRAKTDARTMLGDLGEPSVQGVVGENFAWTGAGYYSFSLRNQLKQSVRDVSCLVIFFDRNQKPIDVDSLQFPDVIPARLAKRLTGKVDESVQRLTAFVWDGHYGGDYHIEIRILDFRLAE